MMYVLSLAFVGLVVALPGCQMLDNNLAKTPPMGWIAWERFTCTTDCKEYPNDCINEGLFRQMAFEMANGGYKEVGYEYINIDDCWSEMHRDSVSGRLIGNLERFPNGIVTLSSYIHSKGLKMGIYGDCGTKTCDGYPAQLKTESLQDNNFQVDADTFHDWEIDSFKFDGCYLDAHKAESICPQMSVALNKTGRPMIVICEWPFYSLRQHPPLKPNYTIAQQACNVWRYYEDVEDSWMSILNIVDFTLKVQLDILKYHGPGHWFDPDQLIIGNFALSLDQARAQMALWCIWSAPLYMGNDLRSISDEMADILKNKKLIAVDQDQMGVFGLMVAQTDNNRIQAFVKPVEPIKNGCPSFVIAYLNRNTLGNTREASFSLRSLLSKVPFALAAHRFHQVYPNSVAGVEFSAENCKNLIKLANTKNPNTSKLLVRPASEQDSPPPVEETVVQYDIIDLFDDEDVRSIYLNETLTLRVNPSGVRIVKLLSVSQVDI